MNEINLGVVLCLFLHSLCSERPPRKPDLRWRLRMCSVLSLALLIKTTLLSLINKPNSVVLAVCLTLCSIQSISSFCFSWSWFSLASSFSSPGWTCLKNNGLTAIRFWWNSIFTFNSNWLPITLVDFTMQDSNSSGMIPALTLNCPEAVNSTAIITNLHQMHSN